jgi:DNA-binding transcriptional LysR family regulator
MDRHSHLPDLALLRGFEAAARHLSFTKAGAELHVTQSAVSRQIRLLEETLGVRLFERRARSLVLTDAGYQYYVEVQRMLRQLHEVTERVRAARSTRSLRVTTTPTFASLWLIPRLAHFQKAHPELHVHVVADNTLRDLDRDDFDVAIRYSSRSSAGREPRRLFDERLVPLCSPALLRPGTDRVAALQGCVLIHFNDIDGYAPWLSWDHWFSGIGERPLRGRGALHFSHYDQAIRAAIAGQGVALGRLPVADYFLRDGNLVAPLDPRRFAFTLADRAYWTITTPRGREKREVQAFAGWLAREAKGSASRRNDWP